MAHKNRTNWSPYSARRKSSKPPSTGQPPGSQHRLPTESFGLDEADDRIYDVFRHHGFADVPHETRRRLTKFYLLLMKNQQDQNFTRLTSLRDVAIKHFIDSLMPARLTELRFPLLDVGTGPGFPGLPLKILFPGETIGLAEGVQKRVEFLKRAREALGLDRRTLPIFGRNVNEDFRYPFAGVVTRAVEDARNTLRNVSGCLPIGGRVYLMKGPNCGPEIPAALEEMGRWYRLADDIAYSLPETPHERRLLVFEKTSHLPQPEDLTDLSWSENAEPEDGAEAAFLRKLARLPSCAWNASDGKSGG